MAIMYAVKEIFYTLQGEGANAGRPAVFCRFAGCNLWSGREQDRAAATCTFCDTDFVGVDGDGGGRFRTGADLAAACAAAASEATQGPDVTHSGAATPGAGVTQGLLVVLTGGEPMLQVDEELVEALHAMGFEIAIETNGTLAVAPGIDWVCVSPKAGATLVQISGDELKLVYPQPDLMPEAVAELRFSHRYLQPMDGPERARNTADAVAYCKAHPQWRLSLQTHKLIGIP